MTVVTTAPEWVPLAVGGWACVMFFLLLLVVVLLWSLLAALPSALRRR